MLRDFRLHKLIIFIFTTCSLILASNPVLASFYKQTCEEQGLGWHFYCDRQKAEIDKEDNKKILSQSQAETANKTVEDLKKQHDTLLNTAIIFPTEENIKKYLAFNLENLNRSSFFAESAQRAIWQTPDLNYNLKRPVNSVGKRTWIDEQSKKKKDTALSLNLRYGVFFFYRGDCPYCHAYSPVLRSFADTYDIEIKGVSLDGKILKEFPNSIIDSGQASKLGINAVPATILFDKQTQEVIPVGYGALSQEELLQQIYVLTKTKPGEEL
jgi:conjugal transfer pilus assembly protein TraF